MRIRTQFPLMYSATWPKPLEKIFPSTTIKSKKKKKKKEFEDNSFSRIEKNRVKSVEKFFSRRQKPPRRPLLLRVYEARAETWFSDSFDGKRPPPRANDGMSMTRNDARRNDARSINQRLGQECQFLSLPLVSLANRSRLIIPPSLRAIRPCRVPLSVDKLSTELSIRWLKDSLYLYAKTNSVYSQLGKIFASIIYIISVWKVERYCFANSIWRAASIFFPPFSIKIETSRLRIFVPAHIFVN